MFSLNPSSGQSPVRGRFLGYRVDTGHQEKKGKNEVGDLANRSVKVTMLALSRNLKACCWMCFLVYRNFSLYIVTGIGLKYRLLGFIYPIVSDFLIVNTYCP